jgi:FkbM family methyltransferase
MLKAAVRAARSRYRQALGTEARLRPVKHDLPLIRLGSGYGGWTFVDRPELHGSTIISGGLGEDASFDLAFAERYNARVVAVDPTPRAIAYFHTLADARLTLCTKALWNETTTLRLFPPANPAHVSHSFVDIGGVGTSIDVEATTMEDLVRVYGLPPLAKLDIERAEIEVICHMMATGIFPAQILVEYDEMQKPSRDSRLRVERAHEALSTQGYVLLHRDVFNFLYLRH